MTIRSWISLTTNGPGLSKVKMIENLIHQLVTLNPSLNLILQPSHPNPTSKNQKNMSLKSQSLTRLLQMKKKSNRRNRRKILNHLAIVATSVHLRRQ